MEIVSVLVINKTELVVVYTSNWNYLMDAATCDGQHQLGYQGQVYRWSHPHECVFVVICS